MKGSSKPEPKRYFYLDNIKWVLAVLVIIHHSAGLAGLDPMGFNLPQVVSSNQWQYNILNIFQGNNQSFFMGTFFFISALFVIASYQRKGAGLFILDKLKRLGIPTLIWLVVILPILGLLGFMPGFTITNITGLFSTGQINLGVTWFCWTLIVFNILWLIIIKLTKQKSFEINPTPLPSFCKILLFTTLMIPLNLIGLYLQNKLGGNFLGFHDLKYFAMYLVIFFLGVHAYRANWLEQIEFKHAAIGILMWLFARYYINPIFHGYGYGLDAFVALRGYTVIGMTLFLTYLFKALFNHKNKLTALLSRTAYAAYVFQIPFLYIVTKLYQPYMTQTPFLNFVIIAIPSVILSFAFAYIICKLPVLRKIF